MPGENDAAPKVNFPDAADNESPTHKRHLTARYDKKTRRLMKEKLDLEDYIFTEIRKVYMRTDDEYDCEIDVDQLIPMEESDRRKYIEHHIANAPCSADISEIHKVYSKQGETDGMAFIQTVLEKLQQFDNPQDRPILSLPKRI